MWRPSFQTNLIPHLSIAECHVSPWQAVQSRILVSSWQTQASPGPGNERWRKRFNMVENPRSYFCTYVTSEWMRKDKHHSAHPSASSFSSLSTASPSSTTWQRMQRYWKIGRWGDERSGQTKHLPRPHEFTLHCCYTETKKQRAMSPWISSLIASVPPLPRLFFLLSFFSKLLGSKYNVK